MVKAHIWLAPVMAGFAMTLLFVRTGHAAGLDCSKAKAPIERSICGDPAASAAHSMMDIQYERAADQLSPASRTLLRDSQRSFLRYAADLCRPGAVPLDAASRRWRWSGKPAPANTAVVVECVADVFDKRSNALGVAVIPLGGRVFFTLMTYRVRPTVQEDDRSVQADAVTETKALVQIDLPRTQADKDWNHAMAGLIQKPEGVGLVDTVSIDGGNTDVDVRMSLVSASANLIVTRIDLSNYSKGSPHPQSAHWIQNWFLPSGRMLTKEDVFDGSKPWSTALAVEANVNFEGYASPKPETPITEIGQSDRQWAFTSNGLEIGYDPYSLGSYISGGHTVIPWKALAPFLRRPFPFDPEKLTEPKTPIGGATLTG